MRASGVFTGTTNSPSRSPRQSFDRYAIRAGRNLPDKEFRYLRTVIVTAAVYRGFNSELAPLLLTFRHRAGVRPYTSPYGFAEPCVFDKQSLPPGLCHSFLVAQSESRLSRSYACNLPSSFSIVLSSALVYSTSPPVSVSGTVSVRVISRNPFTAGSNPVSPDNLRNSSLLTGSGIFCLIPIDYAFRPHLRGRLTLRRLALRRNPWTFGESVSHTLCRYSCQHYHFRYLQPASQLTFTGLRNAPLPRACAHPYLR